MQTQVVTEGSYSTFSVDVVDVGVTIERRMPHVALGINRGCRLDLSKEGLEISQLIGLEKTEEGIRSNSEQVSKDGS
ncbi:hypothetical protein DGG96_08370 [Legionella qingyii]|uniref:Uncharacterized protein n=1 Tax=Legionella qingyii TaxID=2184757 RepID=A0A317U4F0_9GAMM|nr:hypothetical protein DGG96_08370 [Legionella qingyii]